MPTIHQITQAVAKLGVLRFFPTDGAQRVAVMEMLSRMVSEAKQLDWLVATMVDRVGEWRGTAELRGVFCSRFKPADGIEANLTPECPLYQSSEQCEEREKLISATPRVGVRGLDYADSKNGVYRVGPPPDAMQLQQTKSGVAGSPRLIGDIPPSGITAEEAASNREFTRSLVSALATTVLVIPAARSGVREITQDDVDRAVMEHRAARQKRSAG